MRRILSVLVLTISSSAIAQADGLNWSLILGGSQDNTPYYQPAPRPPVYIIAPPPRRYEDQPIYVYPDEYDRHDERHYRHRDEHHDDHQDEGDN
jgi:hypothetical protein